MEALLPYEAPGWVAEVKNIPKFYVKLAQRPTPIQVWKVPATPAGFQISIKRDDLTGNLLSGNKVRKLEFLLADAISQNYNSVITCGGLQSNHCRATAIAARQLGLNCHLMLRSYDRENDLKIICGNAFLNRMVAAQIHLVPIELLDHWKGGFIDILNKLANKLRDEKGEKAYPIPVGGSTHVGAFGYIEAFKELIDQGLLQDFDDLVTTAGSGGTVAGLAIANYLTGSRIKCHGICVSDDADFFYKHIDDTLEGFGLTGVKARDICDIVDGHMGRGYALSTDEELEKLIEIAQSTGVVLDPTYTLKAARGMLLEMENNPSRFKGKRILFIHTGGLYGLFDGRMEPLLLGGKKTQNRQFNIWENVPDDPLIIL